METRNALVVILMYGIRIGNACVMRTMRDGRIIIPRNMLNEQTKLGNGGIPTNSWYSSTIEGMVESVFLIGNVDGVYRNDDFVFTLILR